MNRDYLCPICRSAGRVIGVSKSKDVVECEGCGLRYFNRHTRGQPVAYDDWYKDLIDCPLSWPEEWISGMGKSYLKQIRILERLVSEKRVLDIGCGIGIFLAVAKKEGWETYGVDESKHGAYFAEKNFNIKYNQNLSSLPANSMDVIRVSHVIEHSAEPDKLLTEISRIIKPSGILMVIAPHREPLCEMIVNKFRRLMSRKPELAGSIYPDAHILGFNTKALSVAAERFGFRTIDLFTTSMGDTTYYPLFFDGLLNIKRPKQISPVLLLRYWAPIFINNLGNRFNRGSWIVGYFKKDEK